MTTYKITKPTPLFFHVLESHLSFPIYISCIQNTASKITELCHYFHHNITSISNCFTGPLSTIVTSKWKVKKKNGQASNCCFPSPTWCQISGCLVLDTQFEWVTQFFISSGHQNYRGEGRENINLFACYS